MWSRAEYAAVGATVTRVTCGYSYCQDPFSLDAVCINILTQGLLEV
jgi:hypothetical protein